MNPHRKRELRRAREVSTFANLLRPRRVLPVLVSVGDRRRFDPTKSIAPPFAFRRHAVRLVDRPVVSRIPRAVARSIVAFAEPRLVMICKRRKERREVLLAKGFGGGRHRKPRRNQWSDVSCR